MSFYWPGLSDIDEESAEMNGGYIPLCPKTYKGDKGLMGVRPLPCVRDENGEIRKQTVKALFAKIDEELNELKEAVFRSEEYDNDLNEFSHFIHEFEKKPIAEEAADVKTAITTLEEALGIDAAMRDEAQRQVNERNRERGRL